MSLINHFAGIKLSSSLVGILIIPAVSALPLNRSAFCCEIVDYFARGKILTDLTVLSKLPDRSGCSPWPSPQIYLQRDVWNSITTGEIMSWSKVA